MAGRSGEQRYNEILLGGGGGGCCGKPKPHSARETSVNMDTIKGGRARFLVSYFEKTLGQRAAGAPQLASRKKRDGCHHSAWFRLFHRTVNAKLCPWTRYRQIIAPALAAVDDRYGHATPCSSARRQKKMDISSIPSNKRGTTKPDPLCLPSPFPPSHGTLHPLRGLLSPLSSSTRLARCAT